MTSNTHLKQIKVPPDSKHGIVWNLRSMFRIVSRIELNWLKLEYNGLEIKKIATEQGIRKNGKIGSCIWKPGRGERGRRRFLGWVGLSLKSKNHPTIVLCIFSIVIFSIFESGVHVTMLFVVLKTLAKVFFFSSLLVSKSVFLMCFFNVAKFIISHKWLSFS